MIRRLVTMAEAVDVKAGVRNVLERIEAAVKTRPEKVKFIEIILLKKKNKHSSDFSSKIRFSWLLSARRSR